jgi:hypothetical protein
VVGHLVGGDPVESARVVIHTYSGRLGLTITPQKSGEGIGRYPKRKENTKKNQKGRSCGEEKKKGAFDGRERKERIYIPVVGGRGGEHAEALLYV